MWIGLLWYFNFVQIPNMPSIPDDQKPAISKVIAPAALWWFRWGAMATIITGLILAYINGYLHNAMTLTLMGGGSPYELLIGIGMWLGTIMWFNVWFVIWPNQKKALGIVEADADVKAASARTAMLFSRTNTMLSIPMLFSMVIAQKSILGILFVYFLKEFPSITSTSLDYYIWCTLRYDSSSIIATLRSNINYPI